MEKENVNSRLNGNIALRKIPSNIKDKNTEILTDNGIDKIKILEFSTAVDKWEQEILFSENGFYSLKGKDAENKIKDFLSELQRFIEKKINEMSFSQISSKETAIKIKEEKLKAVRIQMELYVQEQLNDWEISTYEDALDTTIKRAVLYKKNLEVLKVAYQNGLKILEVISQKDEWNEKLYSYRKKQYISDFYIRLIESFIKEKDITAYQYFNTYKDLINTDEKEKIEKQVNEMRVNIIAYNWAKEVFSYNLDENKFEKELKNIKDLEIKSIAKEYYSELKKSQKRKDAQTEKEKNIQNWKEVMDFVQKDIDKADLYIDYAFTKESIKRKKEYIRQIRETGAVTTNIQEFLKLFEKSFTDFKSFKDSDISDYRGCLSEEDFLLFDKIQNFTMQNYIETDFDFKYIAKIIKDTDVKQDKDKVDIIRMYFAAIEAYKLKKNENADLDERKKIIELILERYNKKLKNNG